MSDAAKIDLVDRALNGSDGANDIRLFSDSNARVSQQYIEVIEDGALGTNRARVSQQYLEVIDDGALGNNVARVSQQFLEAIVTFGTPPVGNTGHGKSDDAPGHTKGGSVDKSYTPLGSLAVSRARGLHDGFGAEPMVFIAPHLAMPARFAFRDIVTTLKIG